ncbi:MAG: ABC transporter ATP-binding protein [Candidatus Thermoplasmatota archaeon]|jgi:peptide/nickel transport system ATP-binding protein|nr:ABC transporter ATP-binding protein [Candidatus Thermoplasmatota archaeon]
MQQILRTEGIGKQFLIRKGLVSGNILQALDDVNIYLNEREILALVGASGSGKSTLARLLVLLYRPTSGKIYFMDEDVTRYKGRKLKKYRSEIQMVFQDPYASLDPYHTVDWHIRRPLILSHFRGNIDERIDELLDMVRLNPPSYFREKFPHQISGGQRQRVYLARALAVNPKVLIADEPVSMLDVSLRIEVLDLLSSIRDQLGIGVIYITHDLNTVSVISDRIYVLHNGKIVEEGNTPDLIKNPSDPYTRALIDAAPDPYKRL